MQLDFETKMKEMALKYNTQIDTAKIKAEADLDKLMVAGNSKILEQAQKSANMLSQQVKGLDGNERPDARGNGSKPLQQAKQLYWTINFFKRPQKLLKNLFRSPFRKNRG